MILLLNLLPFVMSLTLITIGWHDHRFPEAAIAPSWKWWFMIGGLFLYMASWNGWDRYRAETRDPLSRPSTIGLAWFSLTLGFPVFLGLLVPIVRLLIMAIVVEGIALLIERIAR